MVVPGRVQTHEHGEPDEQDKDIDGGHLPLHGRGLLDAAW